MKTFVALLKRERWEHPALWIVPGLFATLMVLGHLFGIYSMWRFGVDPAEVRWGLEQITMMDPTDRHMFVQGVLMGLAMPFNVFLLFLVFFYSLDSLYADRRDRSILFWKSMPVSDVETVMSKLAMALLVAPALSLAVVIALQLVSVVIGTGIALWSGADGWYIALNPWVWVTTWSKLAWALFAQSLLILPVIAWVMLASAWARKAPFLWATVPPAVVVTLEFWNFDRSRLVEWFGNHMTTGAELAMTISENGRLGRVTIDGHSNFEASVRIEPVFDILWSGTLWSGVAIAAVFLAGAVWLRRYRAEPE